jgi:AraC-like DNA-binding protein
MNKQEWIRFGNWAQLRPTLLWAYSGGIPSWAVELQFDGVRQPIDVWYLEEGTLTLHFEDEIERYGAGSWIFPRHRPLRQVFSPRSRHVCIRFTLHWPDESPLLVLDRTLSFPRKRYQAFGRRSSDLVAFVEDRMKGTQIFFEERAATLSMMPEFFSLFWSWIGAYISVLQQSRIPMSPRSALDPRVALAMDYLRNLPLSEPLREKRLASHCSLSVTQLNRLFHQQIGHTPVQIRNNQRMSAACHALLYSNETIKSLAYRLGFNSPQHFSFWFRKRTRKGPREFRKTH